MASQPKGTSWLSEHGPIELELLFRAIVFYPSAPILLTDDARQNRDASIGAGKLLGLPRDKIIGRSLDDFTEPGLKPAIAERWNTFLEEGRQEGTLQLVGSDGNSRNVEYLAKGNVLPVWHVLALREKASDAPADNEPAKIPAWVQDYALFLLDADGRVFAWYQGAERIYGYKDGEMIGQSVSLFETGEDVRYSQQEQLRRAAGEGHFGAEGWQVKKDGSRFWANTITMALRDGDGTLQGYARVVRDFTDRHEKDEKLRRERAHRRPLP